MAADMTAARARLEAARRAEEEARRAVYAAELAVEEEEGRPDSREAVFARAVLTHDLATLSRMAAERNAEWRKNYPDDYAASEAEIARAMQGGA